MILAAIIAFTLAFLSSLILAPLVRRVALRVGLTDDPDGHRKMQTQRVALGGGLVVYLSVAWVVGAVFICARHWLPTFSQDWSDAAGFAAASTILVLVGLADDRFGLRGRHKLLGQLLACGCLMGTGLVVHRIGLFGMSIDLGLLSVPFTIFWLLGAINAINLLDGIDGLATMLGIILAATMAALAIMVNYHGVALLAIVLTGSLLGFLRYNWPPARMYLGDAGSMLIGLLVGAMAIRANIKSSGTLLLAAPLAIWAIPILDSGAAIIRRRLTGRSLFMTDRGHLHHRLLETLGSNTRVLMVVGACCMVTSIGALISVLTKHELYSIVSCLGVVAILLATGLFGRAELHLLLGRARSLGASLARPTRINGQSRQSQVHLQGTQKWDVLWETLTESADKLQLDFLQLDINAPSLHESYVATWRGHESRDEVNEHWRIEIPLCAAGRPLGSLLVHGRRNGDSCLADIAQLLDLLDPFEQRLASYTRPTEPRPPELAPATQ